MMAGIIISININKHFFGRGYKNMKIKRSYVLLFICASMYNECIAQTSNDSIIMDSIIHNLPEIMVSGERPTVKINKGKLTYDMNKLIENKGIDNVYDALRVLPTVDESGNGPTLAGKSVTILIDGRKTSMSAEQLNSYLKALPANRLKAAEVLYTAPAKYQVRGAVINIILDKKMEKEHCFQGKLTSNYVQEHDASFIEGCNILYKDKGLSLDLLYNYSHNDGYGKTNETSIHTLDDCSIHNISTLDVLKKINNSHLWRFDFNYQWKDKSNMSFTYNGNYNNNNCYEYLKGNIISNNRPNSNNTLHDVNFLFSSPIGITANVEYTYYKTPSTQDLTSVLPTGSLNFKSKEQQQINRWTADFCHDFSLSKTLDMNYGFSYVHSVDDSWQEYQETGENTAYSFSDIKSRQKEDILDVFAGIETDINENLALELSLTAGYYHNFAWHKWRLFPSLILTYSPNSTHYLQFGFSSDRTFPKYWECGNFSSYSNGGYNETVGNPMLKPSNEYSLQFEYLLHRKYNFLLWYNYNDDYFIQAPYQQHDRLTITYKCLNLDYQRQIGSNFSFSSKIKRFWDLRTSLMVVWQNEKCSQYYDISFNRSIMWGMLNIRNTFKLITNRLFLNFDGKIRTKAIQAIYDLPSSGSVDINVVYKFLKEKAIIKLYCNDLFETSSINPNINYCGQNLNMKFSCYRQMGISFSYSFGNYENKERKKVDTTRFKN